MSNIESKNIDISCNYAKIKFSLLDSYINSDECINKITHLDKFIILFDMSYILSTLESICDSNKDNSDFTDVNLDESKIMRLVYGILNSVAHYRHYISDKLSCKSVIILYASNAKYYISFDKTFKKISKILNLFKKTIFIEKIENESKFLYSHVAYFTAMNILSLNNAINKKCRIMYIGNNALSFQLLRIDRDMFHIKHNYIESGSNIFFKDFIGKTNTIENTFINIDLVTSLLCILGFSGGFPKLDSMKHKRISIIYSIISNNCLDIVDKDNYSSIVKGLNLSNNDLSLFGLRLKLLDVDFHNKLYSLSKTLFNIFNSKIETKSIHSFNDFFKFNDLILNVQWLMG